MKKDNYITIAELKSKYNIGEDTLYSWRQCNKIETYKKDRKLYINESDVIQRIYEDEYSLRGISEKSGHGLVFIRHLCEAGKLDFWKTETGRYVFPIGTELLVKDLFEKSKLKSEIRQHLIDHNRKIVKSGKIDECHVAKLDLTGKTVAVFLNRNQAVRAFFKAKNLSDKEIQYKYLAYNGALYNKMLDGLQWGGYFYKYVSNTLEPTEIFPTIEDREYTIVNSKGEEKVITKKKDIAIDLDVSMWSVHTNYIDTGKTFPKSDYSAYTKGKTMEFDSSKKAISFYRIGKDKFKKLYEANQPIRGQQVTIKQ